MNRIYCVLIVLLLAACSPAPTQISSQPTIAQTPTILPVTETPIPTATAQAQPTAVPTDLPQPSPTAVQATAAVAAPAILADYLVNPSIASFDSFDTLGDWITSNSQAGLISNGMFIITGQPGGMSGLTKATRLAEGQGVLFDFQYIAHTQFQFILEAGEPKTSSYRSLSVFPAGSPIATVTQGRTAIGTNRFTGNFIIKNGNWYSYMAGIGTQGNFVAIIWDKNNPSHVVKFQRNLAAPWDNLSWQFSAKVADKYMKLSLDNFSVINFDDLKAPLK